MMETKYVRMYVVRETYIATTSNNIFYPVREYRSKYSTIINIVVTQKNASDDDAADGARFFVVWWVPKKDKLL